MFYTIDLSSKESVVTLSKTITDLSSPTEQKYYYINSLNCTIDFHECKKIFEKVRIIVIIFFQKTEIF